MEKINVRFGDNVMDRVKALSVSLGSTPSTIARVAMNNGLTEMEYTVNEIECMAKDGDELNQMDLLK